MVEIARDCSLLEILIEKFIIFWNNENDGLWYFFFLSSNALCDYETSAFVNVISLAQI